MWGDAAVELYNCVIGVCVGLPVYLLNIIFIFLGSYSKVLRIRFNSDHYHGTLVVTTRGDHARPTVCVVIDLCWDSGRYHG